MSDIADSAKTEKRRDRLRRSMVALACALNIGAVVCLENQIGRLRSVRGLIDNLRELIEDLLYYPLANYSAWVNTFVNDGIWLAPTIAVLLLRKYLTAAICYALILLPIMLGRIYYVLPAAWTGDSGHHQKGDWASWAMTLVGAGSVLVIALWLILFVIALAGRATGHAGVQPKR